MKCLVLVVSFFIFSPVLAKDGYRNSPLGPAGPPGPAGPVGPQGESADGNLTLNLGVSAQWWDAERWGLSSGYRHDLHHGGHIVDLAVLNLKIGEDYHSKEIRLMQRELDTYKQLLYRVSDTVSGVGAGEDKPIHAKIKGSSR